MDMIVSLQHLPPVPALADVRLLRVLPTDRHRVLKWVEAHFPNWVDECEQALCAMPATCFLAARGREILGFSCYDATAKGFFGPIGVAESERGRRIGEALLIRTLEAMHESGYGYAVIGWCDDAAAFYEKTVGATRIAGSEPANSVYERML